MQLRGKCLVDSSMAQCLRCWCAKQKGRHTSRSSFSAAISTATLLPLEVWTASSILAATYSSSVVASAAAATKP